MQIHELGARIRLARKAQGWTQTQLADAAGVSRPSVARIETGDDVSTATLAKVAGALRLEFYVSHLPEEN